MPTLTAVLKNPIVEVPVESVVVPEGYIRRFYNDELMTGLKESMDSVGQIYPLVVRPIGKNQFELLIGSRRLQAAKQKGHRAILAVVCRFLEDRDALILALAENLSRQDLTIFEEASAVLKICGANGAGLSPSEVARRIGRPESWVRGRLQLMSMPPEVQDMVATRKLPSSHVKTLAKLGDPEKQKRYAKAVVTDSLSQADLTHLLREDKEDKVGSEPNRSLKVYTARRAVLKIKAVGDFFATHVRPILQGKSWGRSQVVEALTDLHNLIGGLLCEATGVKGKEPLLPGEVIHGTQSGGESRLEKTNKKKRNRRPRA